MNEVIDLQILLDRLIEENEGKKGQIRIQPDEFCDVLSNGENIEISGVSLNQRVILDDRDYGESYEGYSHTMKYSERIFNCVTSVEVYDMDYLWGN